MIREDGTTTWEKRKDLDPGIINKTWGDCDTATGMTYQSQGLNLTRDDFPENYYFVFQKQDFFLPGYLEIPYEKRYWDDSVKFPGQKVRGQRIIYDIVVKLLGNWDRVSAALRRESGYPEELLEKFFQITADDPDLMDYLDLMLDHERGRNRLRLPHASTLRDLIFKCPVTKKSVTLRNPDYLPEYINLQPAN